LFLGQVLYAANTGSRDVRPNEKQLEIFPASIVCDPSSNKSRGIFISQNRRNLYLGDFGSSNCCLTNIEEIFDRPDEIYEVVCTVTTKNKILGAAIITSFSEKYISLQQLLFYDARGKSYTITDIDDKPAKYKFECGNQDIILFRAAEHGHFIHDENGNHDRYDYKVHWVPLYTIK
jgi:hypothetical protein